MAFDKTPTTWLPNWSEDATNVTVPIATFPELTAAEADGATGDIRKILFALCEAAYQAWLTQGATGQPTKMTISRNSSVNELTNEVTRQYTLVFVTEPAAGATEVVDEPS